MKKKIYLRIKVEQVSIKIIYSSMCILYLFLLSSLFRDLKHSFHEIFGHEASGDKNKVLNFFNWAKDKAKFWKKKDSVSSGSRKFDTEERKMDKFSQYISKPVTLNVRKGLKYGNKRIKIL